MTGKYKSDERLPPGNGLADDLTRYVEACDKRSNDLTFPIPDEVRAVAQEVGATMTQVSLAWVRQHPQVGVVILGTRNIDQLANNLSSLEVTLNYDNWNLLEQASKPHQPDYPHSFSGVTGGR